jgi:hypothetical protein
MTARIGIALVDSELARLIEGWDGAARRRGLEAGVRLAVGRASLVDERVVEAWQAIAAGKLGERPERAAIVELVDELDQVAWDVQDEVSKGYARQEEYDEAFTKARAAAAVGYMFEVDARRAALESLYEAHYAIEDLPALRAVVAAAGL